MTIDFALAPSREVTVYCAGLPEDSCASVRPSCTRPLLPMGESCRAPLTEPGGPSVCPCPEGPAAIRGGGRSVTVEPGESVAWLDFRRGGGIEGVAVTSGPEGPAPVPSCSVRAHIAVEGVGDLINGLYDTHRGRCDAEGRFALRGLPRGRWTLSVHGEGTEREIESLRIEGRMLDVGEVELGAEGVITGVVLDGLTGEGAPGLQVKAAGEGRARSQAQTRSGSEGLFTLRGLDDGPYSVTLIQPPFDEVEVVVEGGQATGEVVLETGAADLLDQMGFSLQIEGGELVVDVMLEQYSGPGVGFVVERGGEEVELSAE